MMPQKNAPQPLDTRGGDANAQRTVAGENGQAHGKLKVDSPRRPEIARPEDGAAYVGQTVFVACWFLEMLERVRSGEGETAAGAREALGRLLVQGCMELEPIALGEKDGVAKEWAGRTLAQIGALMGSDHGKLAEGNEAYKAERLKLGRMLRKDLWFPEKPLYQALGRELWRCWYYRGELIGPLAQRYVEELKVPMAEEYRPCLKLAPLSPASLKDWDELLWRLVKQHNSGLLEGLRGDAERNELAARYGDGTSTWEVKRVRLSLKHVRTQFRNHLTAIAEAMV
jgi:hypothetical protein